MIFFPGESEEEGLMARGTKIERCPRKRRLEWFSVLKSSALEERKG